MAPKPAQPSKPAQTGKAAPPPAAGKAAPAAAGKSGAPVTGKGGKPAKPVPAPVAEVPEWKKALYAPARVAKFVNGQMTLQELHGITGPEMMEMAVTGFTMYEQGRYQQAKVIFEGLGALDPKEAYYRTALGAVFLAEGKLDEAVKALDEAIRIDVKDLAAYVNRGEAYLRKGDLIKAALDFKKSVELDPKAKDPLTRRAKALAAAVLKSIEEAQSAAKSGGKAAPKSAAKPAPGVAKGKSGKR
jgi:tetratricopeptide (TPR) repeat protein